MNECNRIGVQDVSEIPIFDLPTTIDYFFGVENIVDQHSGQVVPQAVLVPGEKLFPNGNNANQFFLEANNDTLEVPEGQVVPAYVQPGPTSNTVVPADSTHPAMFVVVEVIDGLARCQSTGILNMYNGHEYKIIGAQYYRSNQPGQVTTSNTLTGQKVFIPVSNTQLLLNLS